MIHLRGNEETEGRSLLATGPDYLTFYSEKISELLTEEIPKTAATQSHPLTPLCDGSSKIFIALVKILLRSFNVILYLGQQFALVVHED